MVGAQVARRHEARPHVNSCQAARNRDARCFVARCHVAECHVMGCHVARCRVARSHVASCRVVRPHLARFPVSGAGPIRTGARSGVSGESLGSQQQGPRSVAGKSQGEQYRRPPVCQSWAHALPAQTETRPSRQGGKSHANWDPIGRHTGRKNANPVVKMTNNDK